MSSGTRGRAAYFFILLALLFLSACEAKKDGAGAAIQSKEDTAPKLEMTSFEDLPFCEVKDVDKCETETSTESETIYRCPVCGTTGQCPHCSEHDCKTCGSETCRCRVKQQSPVVPPQ